MLIKALSLNTYMKNSQRRVRQYKGRIEPYEVDFGEN